MDGWDAYGMVLVALSSMYLLPQTIKMWKTKQVRDISFFFLAFTATLHLMWLVYNVHLMLLGTEGVVPYFLNNLFRCIVAAITILIYYKLARLAIYKR